MPRFNRWVKTTDITSRKCTSKEFLKSVYCSPNYVFEAIAYVNNVKIHRVFECSLVFYSCCESDL